MTRRSTRLIAATAVTAITAALASALLATPAFADVDTTAPQQVAAPQFSPQTVSPSGAPAQTTVTVRWADPSGLSTNVLTARPAAWGGDPFSVTRISGDAYDGTYAGIWSVPAGTPPGDYALSFDSVCDAAANCAPATPSAQTLRVVYPTAAAPAPLTAWPVSQTAPVLHLSSSVISAGQPVTVEFSGTPNTTVSVESKTQPATSFSGIGTIDLTMDPAGLGYASKTYSPRRNTRIAAVTADGLLRSNEPLIQVRSIASINARHNSGRSYTFYGSVLPALNQRLVSIYRNGVLAAQGRTNAAGAYSITKTLTAGTYGYQARTGDDTYNLGTTSPTKRFTTAGTTTAGTAAAPAPATSTSIRRGSTSQPRDGSIPGQFRSISVTLDRAARTAKANVVYYSSPDSFMSASVALGVLTSWGCDTTATGRPDVMFDPWNNTMGEDFSTGARGTSSAITGGRAYKLTGSMLSGAFNCATVETWWVSDYHWEGDVLTDVWTADEATINLS